MEQAFKQWKRDDPGSYYKFVAWNHYHRDKYYKELELMEGFVERDGDLFVEIDNTDGSRRLVPLVSG